MTDQIEEIKKQILKNLNITVFHNNITGLNMFQ